MRDVRRIIFALRPLDIEAQGFLTLTEMGSGRAKALVARPSFAPLVSRMREVKQSFGGRSGNSLKDLIYTMFDREVGRRPLGEMIQK